MQTQEISNNRWVEFFDSFSRQHQGWMVNVEITANGQKKQLEARELPLEGIAASLKDKEDTISIILAKGRNEYMEHNVSGARRVLLEKTDEGADVGLRIEAADGSQTRVQFRSPAMPETLDGVTSSERRRS